MVMWRGSRTGRAAGLVVMVVRLYDPAIGRFLQADPVPGGSCNPYDHTCQDPVNLLLRIALSDAAAADAVLSC